AGARLFTISSVSVGGQSQTKQDEKDFFAPAQFFEMSDDEKLSRPSFEKMTAGVSFGSNEFVFNADQLLETEAIEFETIIGEKDKQGPTPPDPKNRYTLNQELFVRQARFGAAGASELRRSGRARYRTTIGKYQVEKEGWIIVAADDLTEQPIPSIEAGVP